MRQNKFSLKSKDFNPFGQLIGLSFSGRERGWSRCVLEVTEKLLNPHGVLHGGVIYSMADTGMGAALYTDLDRNEACTTVEIKIAYFKPVTSGTLTCDSEVIHRGNRIVTLESEVKSDEQLIAKATGTFYIFS